MTLSGMETVRPLSVSSEVSRARPCVSQIRKFMSETDAANPVSTASSAPSAKEPPCRCPADRRATTRARVSMSPIRS